LRSCFQHRFFFGKHRFFIAFNCYFWSSTLLIEKGGE
jgi:hypothetical protein